MTDTGVHPALAALAQRLAPGATPDQQFDVVAAHVASLARRHVAETGCTFRAAAELVVDLLLADGGHRQDVKHEPTTSRPWWADRAAATGRTVWTADDGWVDQ